MTAQEDVWAGPLPAWHTLARPCSRPLASGQPLGLRPASDQVWSHREGTGAAGTEGLSKLLRPLESQRSQRRQHPLLAGHGTPSSNSPCPETMGYLLTTESICCLWGHRVSVGWPCLQMWPPNNSQIPPVDIHPQGIPTWGLSGGRDGGVQCYVCRGCGAVQPPDWAYSQWHRQI